MRLDKKTKKMKKIITTLTLAIITSALALASTPDSMYVHFTGANGDSIVVYVIADIDSIVYYAPEIPQDIDWSSVTEGVVQANAFTDADGKSYSAVKIGTQVWMAENLNVTVATVDTTGGSADNVCQTNDVFVWNNTDASYGKLYSWQAALKACPTGWHLPSNAEWYSLKDYLSTSHDKSEGSALKSTSGWNTGGNGTDNYGFTALPGSSCNDHGTHSGQGNYGYWWSSTPKWDDYAYHMYLSYNLADVVNSYNNRHNGLSVRCLKD